MGILAGEDVAAMKPAIPWLMAVLMFSSGLGLRLQDLQVLRERPWLLPVILVLLHGVVPFLSVTITTLLGFPLETVMGFAILAMIPVSGTCLLWIGSYGGNITLGMTFILVDTIIAPFIIPYVLAFLFGAEVFMDPLRMLHGLFWMLFFPTVLAVTLNRMSGGGLTRVGGKPIAFLAKVAVFIILFINGGIVSPLFHDFDLLFFLVLGMVFALCAFWFLFAFLIGRFLFSCPEDIIAFMEALSIRSTNTGLVIAISYFPPLTVLTVVFNMLFQQPLGAWAGKAASRYFAKRKAGTDPGEAGEVKEEAR